MKEHRKIFKKVAEELIALAQGDLAVRDRLLKENKLMQGYNPEMEAVHKKNAARLKQIIASIGWPTISKVGEEASEAAWLIAQHSIGDPPFMKQSYALVKESNEDVNPQHLAYLYDRICYFEGRPQKYGTQYDDGGLYPVEDKTVVNLLREQLKLKPHRDASIVEAKNMNQHDFHEDPSFNAWRKSVGWI